MSNEKKGSVKFGSTSWEETNVSNQFNKEKSSKDLYMRLESGDNVVRVITKPHEYLLHRFKADPKDPGFGERVLSSAFHGKDVLMDPPYNLKPKRRWLIGVIDRRSGGYKILDMSTLVFKGIQELVRDEDWGDPSQYDVNIKVDKNGGPANYYSVIPKSKRPLSTNDLEIRQNVDLEELKRKCSPPTPEQVEARVAAILAKKNGTTVSAPATNGVSKATVEDDEDDFEFPAVEGSAS